jgi:hypothetical protein
MEPIVQSLRSSFNSGVTKSLKWRIKNLNSLLKLIEENTEGKFHIPNHDYDLKFIKKFITRMIFFKNYVLRQKKI